MFPSGDFLKIGHRCYATIENLGSLPDAAVELFHGAPLMRLPFGISSLSLLLSVSGAGEFGPEPFFLRANGKG